jgi:hypothetical protein
MGLSKNMPSNPGGDGMVIFIGLGAATKASSLGRRSLHNFRIVVCSELKPNSPPITLMH